MGSDGGVGITRGGGVGGHVGRVGVRWGGWEAEGGLGVTWWAWGHMGELELGVTWGAWGHMGVIWGHMGWVWGQG